MDDNSKFRFYYSRRRIKSSLMRTSGMQVHGNTQTPNIELPSTHFTDIGGYNWVRRRRSQLSRPRRRTGYPQFHTFLNSTAVATPRFHMIGLVDVPVELQTDLNINGNELLMPQMLHGNMVEVPIQIVGPTSSTMIMGRRPRQEDTDILHAQLSPFNAIPLMSHAAKKPRTPRSRRSNFDSIIFSTTSVITHGVDLRVQPAYRRISNQIRQRNFRNRQTPEQRSTIQALNTVRKRVARARNRVPQPTPSTHQSLSQREMNAIRQRRSRASRTIEQRTVARAINTLSRRNFRRRLSQQRSSTIVTRPLSNAQLFRNAIDQIEWDWCDECKRRFPDMSAKGLCDFCKKDLENHPHGSMFSASNMMDPGTVPLELSRLTDLECLLIARVHPMMSVYRVNGQQYKYGGNIINFVQDVNVVASELPYKPSDLAAILVVKRVGNNSVKEFVVRREYVRQALMWLKQNHIYYQDLSISEGNIQLLPQDGVPADLPIIEDIQENNSIRSGNQIEVDDCNGPPDALDETFRIDEFQSVGTVSAPIQPNQHRSIEQALQMAEADQTTTHMPFTGEVINEFTREGYITMAFPTLFPYGIADLRQPRLRKVRECQYFQYLMKYHDGRFARDTRFRYFALNSLIRWRALALGDIYVNNNPQDVDLSIQTIRDMVSSGDKTLASRFSYYAKQIRGTRAYWYNRLKELIAMVKQLGPPTIFFTLSAADLQWPELYGILDPTNILHTLNPVEQRREKARLLNENPLVASWFFKNRVQLFFKHFLTNEFSVIDHWYRFEWQNRGSGHVHGFLWLRERPDVSHIATSEHVRRLACQYFDKIVCTMNPDPTFSVNFQDHPCAKKIPIEADLDSDMDDYISLVNCVMRHSRCGTYCRRKSKTTGQEVCRFKFPMEILEESKIVEDPPESNMYRFMGRRNDQLLNSHNRAVLQTWRANIDWSGIITAESVTHYIGKYAAKSEPASKNFSDLLCDIINDPHRPCHDSRSAIKRLLIKSASERDISAQEVCHLLMSYPLTESSRKVVLLNLNEKTLFTSLLRRRRHVDEEEVLSTDPAFVTRYLERPESFQDLSLLQMAKKHYFARREWRTYRVDAVIRVLPELDGKIMPDTEKWESFCRQQVLLHNTYRSIEEAKGGFELWSERYNERGYGNENQPPYIDILDNEFEDECNLQNEELEDWMEAAVMAPYFAPPGTVELGLRTHDITHDWSNGLRKYPSINDDKRFTHSLGQNDQEENHEYSSIYPPTALTDLSPQQKAAHDLVLGSMRSGSTIRLIISGGAGTGKSTVINAIVHSTRELFKNKNAVRIMAPTGVAAFNIGGATIHHELAIVPDRSQSYKKLAVEQCGRMQESFKDTKLILIDEYSMIGRKMLANINLRLRDIFSSEEPFGNISVVLVGDMRQLPPVFDSSLYIQASRDDPALPLLGALSYSSFDRCVILTHVFRQSGDEQSLFRDALQRLSDGKSTFQDWQLFSTRNYSMFTSEEKNSFRYALRLFPTKADATHYNHERLKDLGNPIARIVAKNNCDMAKRARSDEAKGLQEVLLLSTGARVMLRKNLSTHYGLVNGARGIVVDIVYANGEKSPTHMPTAVMVEFDNYTGPKLYDQTNIIPIIPQTTNWKSISGVTCQRTQIPLILCWAITVHKSQGLTLDQAVVNIGPRESLGLTFVALSRTRKLRDLAFDPMFNFERIEKISECHGLTKRREEEERLRQLSISTFA